MMKILNSGKDGMPKLGISKVLNVAPTRATSTVTILDGGMGHQLKARGIKIHGEVGSMSRFLGVAMANFEMPELVRICHLDFIDAGSTVITTNSYSCVPKCLTSTTKASHEFGEDIATYVAQAGKLAREAAERRPEKHVRVAGSLPPLAESYRPDKVGPYDENVAGYRTIVKAITPYADVLLAETMSTADEARAACKAAMEESDLPIWVAWTLDEKKPVLRNGQTIQEAVDALKTAGGGAFPRQVEACMFNCTSPEVIVEATHLLRSCVPAGVQVGGYANGFVTATGGTGQYRDLSAQEYYESFVKKWMDNGATIVGGCCGIFPPHIAYMSERINSSAPNVPAQQSKL
jgi:S-methylmethionine-dependent homocysteine/selenocysteine methylase